MPIELLSGPARAALAPQVPCAADAGAVALTFRLLHAHTDVNHPLARLRVIARSGAWSSPDAVYSDDHGYVTLRLSGVNARARQSGLFETIGQTGRWIARFEVDPGAAQAEPMAVFFENRGGNSSAAQTIAQRAAPEVLVTQKLYALEAEQVGGAMLKQLADGQAAATSGNSEVARYADETVALWNEGRGPEACARFDLLCDLYERVAATRTGGGVQSFLSLLRRVRGDVKPTAAAAGIPDATEVARRRAARARDEANSRALKERLDREASGAVPYADLPDPQNLAAMMAYYGSPDALHFLPLLDYGAQLAAAAEPSATAGVALKQRLDAAGPGANVAVNCWTFVQGLIERPVTALGAPPDPTGYVLTPGAPACTNFIPLRALVRRKDLMARIPIGALLVFRGQDRTLDMEAWNLDAGHWAIYVGGEIFAGANQLQGIKRVTKLEFADYARADVYNAVRVLLVNPPVRWWTVLRGDANVGALAATGVHL